MKLQKALRRASSALVALCLLALSAFAQSDNASISGVVKDPSGAVVANAKVTVKNDDTAFERQAKTNTDGFYIVTNIAPGYYTVSSASLRLRHPWWPRKSWIQIRRASDLRL